MSESFFDHQILIQGLSQSLSCLHLFLSSPSSVALRHQRFFMVRSFDALLRFESCVCLLSLMKVMIFATHLKLNFHFRLKRLHLWSYSMLNLSIGLEWFGCLYICLISCLNKNWILSYGFCGVKLYPHYSMNNNLLDNHLYIIKKHFMSS